MEKLKPDRLSQMASEALQHGMSYGKYMARYKQTAIRREPVKTRAGVTKVCEYCGVEFTRYDKRQRKYCCENCRNSAKYQKRLEYVLDQRVSAGETVSEEPSGGKAVTKVCKQCGRQFAPKSGHFVYCSDMCSRRAIAERNRLAYYRKKRQEVGAHDEAMGESIRIP